MPAGEPHVRQPHEHMRTPALLCLEQCVESTPVPAASHFVGDRVARHQGRYQRPPDQGKTAAEHGEHGCTAHHQSRQAHDRKRQEERGNHPGGEFDARYVWVGRYGCDGTFATRRRSERDRGADNAYGEWSQHDADGGKRCAAVYGNRVGLWL